MSFAHHWVYLQPSMVAACFLIDSGESSRIENIIAVKIAPLIATHGSGCGPAVAESAEIALYTGNDDSIDGLVTPYEKISGIRLRRRIVGGLLNHRAVGPVAPLITRRCYQPFWRWISGGSYRGSHRFKHSFFDWPTISLDASHRTA
jgi:hypothetical protein